MDIIDLTKAFWMLNGIDLKLKVTKVEENEIYLENGLVLSVPDLVKKYNEEYGK